MALNDQIKDLAGQLAADLNTGGGGRRVIDSAGQAFGWTGGLPITVANYVEVAVATGMSVPITRVSKSGTPAARVAEGSPKPNAATITADDLVLDKFSGLAEFTLERRLDSTGLVGAVTSVLGAGSLMAFEADSVAGILTDATIDATAYTSWVAALTGGQAAVLTAGGRPGLVVISAADYATVVTELAGSAGFALSPDGGPVGSFFGSIVHVSSGMTAGSSVVADPAAILAVQHQDSPLLILDPYTLADTNTIRCVSDLVAKTATLDASKVFKVTGPVGP